MTNQELLRRPEIFTNREETDYAEQELIEMIKQDSVLIIGMFLIGIIKGGA